MFHPAQQKITAETSQKFLIFQGFPCSILQKKLIAVFIASIV